MFKRMMFLCLMMLACVSSVQAGFVTNGKMYVDHKELCSKHNTFRIHVGGNEWVMTKTMHRDETGLFTFENEILRDFNGISMAYEKQWKCPYCYSYWPIGKPCGNASCPSKYK
jgi:hypothetical protein